MKKTYSLSLETKLVEDIVDKVQKDEQLSSRSSALERILLYYQFSTQQGQFNVMPNTTDRIKALSTQPLSKHTDDGYTDKAIDSTFANMKD